jgi:hypothetical protein
LLDAATRERRLRDTLGPPPPGSTTWIEHIERTVEDAPPLSPAQRERLKLLLQPLPDIRGGS